MGKAISSDALSNAGGSYRQITKRYFGYRLHTLAVQPLPDV